MGINFHNNPISVETNDNQGEKT